MIKLKIEGMTCGHCVATVTQVLQNVQGTTKVVEVSLERAEAVIEGAPDHAALISSLQEEGFKAEFVE